jgi:hypothetical protein
LKEGLWGIDLKRTGRIGSLVLWRLGMWRDPIVSEKHLRLEGRRARQVRNLQRHLSSSAWFVPSIYSFTLKIEAVLYELLDVKTYNIVIIITA